MVYFCNKYSSKLIFDKDKMREYVITKEKDEFLYRIQEQILKYAKENDGINSIKVHLSKDDLHKLRHQYLHRSNQDDDMIAMYGRHKERHFTRINYEKVCNNRHYSASDRNTRLL